MSESKVCQNCKLQFEIAADDFDFYRKIGVLAPTFCADCRNQYRLATRNVKSLYKRPCDKCGTSVISRFSTHNSAKMYCSSCWWSDDWDPTIYGKDYDFSRSFFEQFHELLFTVPHAAILNSNMIESEYSNMESDDKGCYLTFGGHWNEYCAFSEYSIHGKEVYDSYWVFNGERCYECVHIEKCHTVLYSQECIDCMNTFFSYNCRGCNEVIGCAGLRQKSYCIFNKQYTKEEYIAEKAKMNFGSRSFVADMKQKARTIWEQTPRQYRSAVQVVNSTGNDIFNSKNAQNVWQVDGVENVKNFYIAAWSKDSYDETSVAGSELGYQNASGGGFYNCKAIVFSFAGDFKNKKHTLNSEYGYTIINSNDCFGCVGLRKKQYCILNKQYTKEEYEALLPTIKQHMCDMPFISSRSGCVFTYGDFFPPEHSLFAYNETVANDFYHIEKTDAERKGFIWRDEAASEYTFTDYSVPENIIDVQDDILQAVLKCEHSGKAYKITPQELQFYRTMHIPIPTTAPLQRIKERVVELSPFKLYHRSCMNNCGNDFDTPYSPSRPEVIYCESCYQKSIL